MRLKWNIVLVHSEIVLILTQDKRTVCVEGAIGSEIILDAPDKPVHVKSDFFLLEIVLLSVQDRCTVYAKHTNCSEIILDAPDGTPS
jgi:hypothetical protein